MNNSISPKLPLTRDNTNGFTMNTVLKDSIKQNVKTLFLTSPGERVYDPEFGIGLRKFLFEQPEPKLSDEIKGRISDQVKEYLPFISIVDIDIFSDEAVEHLLYCRFEYFINPLSESDQLDIQILM